MKVLFVMIILFVISSLIYMACYKDRIKNTKLYKKNKITKFTFSYVFLTLAISSTIFWSIYLFTLSIKLGFSSLLLMVLLLISFYFIINTPDIPGIILLVLCISLGFIVSLTPFNENIKENINTKTLYLSTGSDISNEGEILIKLPYLNEDSKINEEQGLPYTIMKYDKNQIKEFKNIEIPLDLETTECEFIDDDNNRIVIIENITLSESLFSIFEFIKPDLKYSNSYKLYINPNNIKYH